jgi:hypothetical protein
LSEESRKKKKIWEVDPHMYDTRQRSSFLERRILPTVRTAAKFGLITLALTYPLYLVYIGLAYGGLAFWSFLAGSSGIIGLILWKLGFAPNYSRWDLGFKRMLGVFGGFAVAFGFYIGLIYLKTLMLPISFALLSVGLFFVLRRGRL